ncbi:MAG: putative phage repressor [Candidatus Saccharibacteria bacterium]|nr:putative phage repressor [Candidatus Saccharibacteria bacterium]
MRSLKSSGLPKRLRLPFVIRQVVGDSMLPTLRVDQIVIAWRWADIREGDVILLRHESRDMLKRVAWVRKDMMFVVGDNVTASRDSRQFGPIKTTSARGRVIFPRRLSRPLS